MAHVFGRFEQKLTTFWNKATFKDIIEDTIEDKNPKDFTGETPLHRAAKKGDLPICRLIIEHLPDKNPRNFLESGDTLLHWAAKKGHLSLCKLIIKNVQDKNPQGIYNTDRFNSESKHFRQLTFSKVN